MLMWAHGHYTPSPPTTTLVSTTLVGRESPAAAPHCSYPSKPSPAKHGRLHTATIQPCVSSVRSAWMSVSACVVIVRSWVFQCVRAFE